MGLLLLSLSPLLASPPLQTTALQEHTVKELSLSPPMQEIDPVQGEVNQHPADRKTEDGN